VVKEGPLWVQAANPAGRRPVPGGGAQAQLLERGDQLPRHKQYAGLEACQCWSDAAMVRHVALALLTFVVLQQLRLDPAEPIAGAKERWRLAVTPPRPATTPTLNACPACLRATA
jgi:hypothetical protein